MKFKFKVVLENGDRSKILEGHVTVGSGDFVPESIGMIIRKDAPDFNLKSLVIREVRKK